MNRRDFLKLGSSVSVAAYITTGSAKPIMAMLPIEAVSRGKIYRGMHDGSILVSSDRGKTWETHASFGPDYSVLDLFTGLDGRLYSHMGYKHYSFNLVLSKNGMTWFSQPV